MPIGLDRTAAMLREGRARHPALRLAQADMLHLPLADGSCPAVVARYVLHNVPRAELPAALAELRRVVHREGGRTILRWRDQIAAWHRAHVSNGPTEAVNNLIKRVKRVAFGFKRFNNYRIRTLLYAGKPNWNLLPTSPR